MKFYATKKQGVIQYHQPVAVRKYIESFQDGQEFQVEMKVRRKYRTLSQNNYYWALLTIVAEDLGYNPEEVHTTFKSMFLTDRSKKIPLVRSTTALNTLEFSQYIEKIKVFCFQDLNISLPAPEDMYV